MSKILIITIARNNQLNPNLANVVTAATQIAATTDILVIGDCDSSAVESLSAVNKILVCKNIGDDQKMAVNIAPIVANIAKNYTHVLTASDSDGKDFMPRVAGILDVAQISDVVGIISPNIFKRPLYAGNIIAEIESFEDIKLLTIRTTSFASATHGECSVAVEYIENNIEVSNDSKLLSTEYSHIETVGLAQAKVIVSGGRSLGSKENFIELIGGLASKLEAAVGASRAAVEAGYVSNDCQVGQTGKIVAPELYIAVGISGAVQHIAGMKDSKIVVAINEDPNAQIFEYADYGIVGDLFEIVPQLIART